MQKTCTSIYGTVRPHRIGSHEDDMGSIRSSSISSLDSEPSHQMSPESSSPLQKHLIFCIVQKCSSSGYTLFNVDNHRIMDHTCARPSLGVFPQAYCKEADNLAHNIVNSGWAPIRFQNLAFARLQGEPAMICSSASQHSAALQQAVVPRTASDPIPSPPVFLLNIPLKSFKDHILHIVHSTHHQHDFPDKEMLDSVQEFFMYTESEGKKVFEELDRDADGRITIDDLKTAMKKMKLPAAYARDFMRSKHLLTSKNFGWSEFSSLMQEKEPMIVQLFNSLGVSKSGTVYGSHVRSSLARIGLSATDVNVADMIKFLAKGDDHGFKYGQFRRFMLLLPTERLTQDPWSVWLKAATTSEMEASIEEMLHSMSRNLASMSKNLPRHFGLTGHSHR
ncbi:hypothetical protein KP509_36G032500 [Ceratopteris richardii]|nr:hypothetical protein KP509_36G032500 [Ceratopteris richardii]